MLTAADIREYLRRQPFEPFKVRMSSGETYEVPHPDMCMVIGRNKIHVGIPYPREKGAVMQVAECAILHVTAIEPLDGERPKTPKRRRKRT